MGKKDILRGSRPFNCWRWDKTTKRTNFAAVGYPFHFDGCLDRSLVGARGFDVTGGGGSYGRPKEVEWALT